eukprot:6445943-Pyramimonas_sp.AAC.1
MRISYCSEGASSGDNCPGSRALGGQGGARCALAQRVEQVQAEPLPEILGNAQRHADGRVTSSGARRKKMVPQHPRAPYKVGHD